MDNDLPPNTKMIAVHYFSQMRIILLLLLLLITQWIEAQVSSIPLTFNVDDTITIRFDATLGDQGLLNFTGDVYMHTGVINTQSADPRDWKNIVANWGTADTTVLMDSVAPNLYEKRLHVRSFYNIPSSDTVLQLAFVMRNVNGSRSARAANGSDMYIPLSGQGFFNYDTAYWNGTTLQINYGPSAVFITPYNEAIYRVSYAPDTSEHNDTSYAVVLPPQPVNAQFTDADSLLYLTWGDYNLTMHTNPFRIITIYQGDTLLLEDPGYYGLTAAQQGIRFAIDTSAYWQGGGSRAIEVDRTGQSLLFYNEQKGGYAWGADPMNATIPLLISSDGLGLFMDNHHRSTAHVGSYSPRILDWQVEGGAVQYFIIAGEGQYDKVLEQYTTLTGRQPMPPRWALGFIQSRYGYTSEQEARSIVANMKAQDFPLDVLILDLYWFDKMGDLDWDRNKWPTAEQMMADFKQQGVKTVNITETYFLQTSVNYPFLANNGYFGTTPQGTPYVLNSFWQGPAGLLDIYQKDAQDWMWDFYRDRINEGVAGWWCDLGEPELHPWDMNHSLGDAKDVHNLYSLIWAEMLDRHYRQDFPDRRIFNLIRSGWAGMQRYGTFPWSGDVQRSWAGLDVQIPIMLGMSMSGHGYMHSDLGGFTGGGQDGELYTRWMQLGAFSPIMRAHGTGVPTEPIFYSEPYKSITRDYIKLRYKFLPHNYSLAYQNHKSGLPLAMPMDQFDPGNPTLQNINNQFYWGENIIVAPVLGDNQSNRSVVLPEGDWYDYWDNILHNGGQTINVSAPIDKLPLFVKAGSFVAQSLQTMEHTEALQEDSLGITYYFATNGNQAQYNLYEDDDSTTARDYLITRFMADDSNGLLTITVDTLGSGYSGMPEKRDFIFTIQGITPWVKVFLDGERLPLSVDASALNSYDSAYFSGAEGVLVKIPFHHQGRTLVFDYDVSVEENMANTDWHIGSPYPNPASEQVTLPIDLVNAGDVTIQIQSITGQTIYQMQRSLSAGAHQISISSNQLPLAAGVYMISATVNGETQVQQLIWQ